MLNMDLSEFMYLHNQAHDFYNAIERRFVEIIFDDKDAIRDNKTDLIWTKDTNYLTKVKYDEAVEELDSTPWRLPTLDEVISILDFRFYDPALFPGLFITSNQKSLIWTNTWYAGNKDNQDDMWTVDLIHGNLEPRGKNTKYNAWPVTRG